MKYDFLGDYYNNCAGYVIDGRKFSSMEDAHNHLIKTGWDDSDAIGYLNRLFNAFCSRCKAAKTAMAISVSV